MQAIILAGGLGTRLRSVLSDMPKPMAPIGNKPFLAYLIEYLKSQGITKVILSVHYLKEQIEDYFKNSYLGVTITYVVEVEALGTGGAIVKSLSYLNSMEPVFVLNGDTFLKMNYQTMFDSYHKTQSPLTMALRKVADCSRYGEVIVEDVLSPLKKSIKKNDQRRLIATTFKEIGGPYPGLINAGVYLINPDFFKSFNLLDKFSFERDFLFPNIPTLRPSAFIVDDYFIDIGIPEDYARANQEVDLFLVI